MIELLLLRIDLEGMLLYLLNLTLLIDFGKRNLKLDDSFLVPEESDHRKKYLNNYLVVLLIHILHLFPYPSKSLIV